jgi:hypothetical protein
MNEVLSAIEAHAWTVFFLLVGLSLLIREWRAHQ